MNADFLEACGQMLTGWSIFWLVLGTFLGVIVGAIPGMTGAMLISLTLPLTFSMQNPADAMILLVAMYVGSVSGGLISATLLRMPGTPSSMMTTLDGYPMAQQGRPGRALGLGITASFVGGTISWLFLVMLAHPISLFAVKLTPFDLFSLVVVALAMIASVAGKSLAKGLLAGAIGILVAAPGTSPADGTVRWTMGFTALNDGFKLLPVLVGMFAISQVLHDVSHIDQSVENREHKLSGVLLSIRDWIKHTVNMIRSSVIGVVIGILPGIGANIGSAVAYGVARNFSRQPERFGEGSEEGIVASESANNGTVGGALIPLVAMGIPGSVIDAILLGALVIHGLQPGPLLFRDNPTIVYTIILTALAANIVMFVLMIAMLRPIAKLMYVPRWLMMPCIVVFCVVGCYSLNHRMFDVWVMLGFGVAGYAMERLAIPLAPFIIGFVLAPIAEKKLGEGLQGSNGSLAPLFTDWYSRIFLIVAAGTIAWSMFQRYYKENKQAVAKPVKPKTM